MDYKMVVLDLDGTLLNNEKIISDKNSHIVSQLDKRGVQIVIATGRNYYMAKSLTEKIKSVKPTILANNGAIARYSHSDELIGRNFLDYSIFENIYEMGIKHNLNPILHVDGYYEGYDLIYECENYEEVYLGYIKEDYKRAIQKKFKGNNINNILSVCYFDDFQKLNQFEDDIKNLPGEFNTIFSQNIKNERGLLEFLNIEGCKWSSLKKYIDSLGIDESQIIALGDDNNDIEMLKNAGIGIAMKNATDQCKDVADYTSSSSNNESGVYHELSKIFEIN